MTGATSDKFQPPDRGRFGDNELAPTPAARGPRVTGASDLKDLHLVLQNDNPTKKAIAVAKHTDAPFEDWIWLPRSLIEYEQRGGADGKPIVCVTLPERLAREKGLL